MKIHSASFDSSFDSPHQIGEPATIAQRIGAVTKIADNLEKALLKGCSSKHAVWNAREQTLPREFEDGVVLSDEDGPGFVLGELAEGIGHRRLAKGGATVARPLSSFPSPAAGTNLTHRWSQA